MQTFTTERAREILNLYPGEEIQVWFYKRSDGSERHMTCTWNAGLHEGSRLPYNPVEKDLFPVLEGGDFKVIPLEGIYRIESTYDIHKPTNDDTEIGDLDGLHREMEDLF